MFELINDIIFHVVECGIFMQIKKRSFLKQNVDSNFKSPTFADTYSAISIRKLHAVFNLLMLSYVLAVACFLTEIICHRFRLNEALRSKYMSLKTTDINIHSLRACVDEFTFSTAEFITQRYQTQSYNYVTSFIKTATFLKWSPVSFST